MGQLSSKRIQLEDISPDDIIIVVIGPSGVGKSTFINTATEKPLLRVSNGLEPCTTKVEHVRCTFQFESSPKQVVFVDTPAFPGDSGSDITIAGLDVEMKIQNWARQTFHQKEIKITGILYLHKINEKRMTQPPFPHYQMFQRLCGEGFHARVLLVTTMWEKLLNQDAGERKKVILERHWSKMIDKGSAVVCHNGDKQSAWDVVMALLDS